MHKDLRPIFKSLKKQGFVWEQNSKGHYKVWHPARPSVSVTALAKVKNNRNLQNLKAELRRIGWVG